MDENERSSTTAQRRRHRAWWWRCDKDWRALLLTEGGEKATTLPGRRPEG